MGTQGKRKKLGIDLSLQLRFAAYAACLIAASLAVSHLSMVHGLEAAARRSERIFVQVEWALDAMRAPFYLSAAISLLIGGVLSLLWSHRLAGPLLVLTSAMRRAREGDLREDIRVRTTDLLAKPVLEFSEMQSALRYRIGEDKERLERVKSRLNLLSSKLQGNGAALAEIEELRRELASVSAFFKV